MAGQIEIKNTDNRKETLIRNTRNHYFEDHFAIKNKDKETDTIYNYLMYLNENNKSCELYEFSKKMLCCQEIEDIKLPILKPCC